MTIDGKTLSSLMRKHRVSISQLADRMQITQKRIRQVRRRGLADGNSARDWVEAITGEDPGPIAFRAKVPHYGTYCSHCMAGLPAERTVVRFGGGNYCNQACAKSRNEDLTWNW